MTDLLKEILYREEEDGTLEYWDLPGYRQADDHLKICHAKVEKALGANFDDDLAAAESDITAIEALAAFHHGFRLAGRLLLDLFSTRP